MFLTYRYGHLVVRARLRRSKTVRLAVAVRTPAGNRDFDRTDRDLDCTDRDFECTDRDFGCTNRDFNCTDRDFGCTDRDFDLPGKGPGPVSRGGGENSENSSGSRVCK